MKKLFYLLITVAAFILAGCSSSDGNLLRAVPDDTEVLARIDLKATAKSMGYSWTDMIKSLPAEFKNTGDVKGIDMMGTVYAFVTENGNLTGVVMPVNDADALREYFTSNGQTVSETDGIYHVDSNAAFDKKRLVLASGAKATTMNLHSLLKQEAVNDDVEELNEQLETIEEPIGITIDGNILKKQGAKDFATGMAMASIPVNLDEIYLLVGIDATGNSAIISTSVATDDSEAQDQLEAIKKKMHPIKGGKIPFVADEYVALAAFNLVGSDLKPYASLLGGFDTDALLNAVNGLATLTVTNLAADLKPAFTFTAQANDIACLDKLMNQIAGYGIGVKDEGRHNWTVDTGTGELMLVGAQGGFVFANYGNNMQRPKGDNTIALEDGTVAYVNFYPSRIPQKGIKQDAANHFAKVSRVEFFVTDELTTQTTITLNGTWKELVERK